MNSTDRGKAILAGEKAGEEDARQDAEFFAKVVKEAGKFAVESIRQLPTSIPPVIKALGNRAGTTIAPAIRSVSPEQFLADFGLVHGPLMLQWLETWMRYQLLKGRSDQHVERHRTTLSNRLPSDKSYWDAFGGGHLEGYIKNFDRQKFSLTRYSL